MKTEVKVRIITNADRIALGYWDADKEEWLEPKSTDEIAKAAEELNCSPALVEALMLSVETVADAISSDLRDIWKRLDAIEARLDP